MIDVKLQTASDKEIFDFAGQAKRIIVTADLDFPRILAMSGSINPALILFRGGNFSDKEIISLLSKALHALPEQKIVHSLVVIEKNRIRRRDLPI